MKKKALILLLLFFANEAMAASDAGCGLGDLIVTRNTKLFQFFAVTSNHTFSSQILGITFGTSNCNSSGIVQNDREIRHFAEINQSDLTKEMAQGEGEKLFTLAALYGCDAASKQSFAKMAQNSFDRISPKDSTTSNELIDNLNLTVKENRICQPL